MSYNLVGKRSGVRSTSDTADNDSVVCKISGPYGADDSAEYSSPVMCAFDEPDPIGSVCCV